MARYDEALQRTPGDFRARLNRGALLSRLGRLEEALRDNQALVRAYVGSAAAHYNLADALLRLDRYAEALAAAERALRLQPTAANILMLRGLALAMLERDAEACKSFSRARAVDAEGVRRFRVAAATAVGLVDEERLTNDPRQIRLARLLERQKTCDWSERERLLAGMRALAADLRHAPARLEEIGLYHTAVLPLRRRARRWRGYCLGVMRAAPTLTQVVDRHGNGRGDEKSLGFLPNSVIIHRRNSNGAISPCGPTRFEVYAYSCTAAGALRQRIVIL